MKIYNCEQRSKEWFDIRDLKMTASHATAVMAAGKGLETLVNELLVNHYSSRTYEEYLDDYTGKHMQRGIDFEERARRIYELKSGNKVDQVGFIEYDEYSGCSPDGIIGNYGLIEIKNLSDKVFFDLLLTGKVDSNHRNQMQMQMYLTQRHWCDYFAFNPNFTPSYVCIRFLPDHEAIMRIKEGLKVGRDMIKRKMSIIEEKLKGGKEN